MGDKVASPDVEIARVARVQHGVISSKQLARAGVSRHAASKRVKAGRLHRLHRGVYAVGHLAPSWQSRWMAAVLACGEGSVISHRSAAHLWGLLNPRQGPIDVSVPSPGGRARRTGVRIHRRATLRADAMTRRRGIPVTTPAQTIADLEKCVPTAQLRGAIRQAEVLGLRTGLKKSERTRSELEHLFLRLCERHRIPMPEVNVRIGPYEVDFLWRAKRLIVETDGYKYHRGSQAFEDDHERDLILHDHGYTVRHFTYRQVAKTPTRVAATLANLKLD